MLVLILLNAFSCDKLRTDLYNERQHLCAVFMGDCMKQYNYEVCLPMSLAFRKQLEEQDKETLIKNNCKP